MRRATVLWIVLAVAGVLLVAGVTYATSRLSTQTIGLSSEPLSAGSELAPQSTPTVAPRRAERRRRATTRARSRATATPSPTAVATPPPVVADDDGSVEDNSGSGSDDDGGHGRGRGRGRGGDDD
jgi:hypothetical protein